MEINNFTQERIQINLNIPYDPTPSELTLAPGEKGQISGWIEIENLSSETTYLKIYFDLHQGYILSIRDSEDNLLLKQHLKMHQTYQVECKEGVWMISNKTEQDSIL